jgi:hypothetical protein
MANILEVIISGDSDQLEAALSKADKQLQSFGKQASEIGKSMSMYITAPLTLAGGAAIKLASDFNESMNKVDVSFKDSSAEVQAFAKNALSSFGIAEGTALDMAALFGDMATSMGLSVDESAKLSTSLVGLAGDLASFKNMNIEEVTTALNGVFTGETESLKRLGVVMTEVNLKNFAMAEGIKKSYENMTQAEKVMLRYNYVMANTTNAQGDFARTSDGAANQMRMFSESLKQVGAQFGQVVLPYVTQAFKAMNSLMVSISETSTTTKTIIMVLGGLAAAIGPVLVAVGFLSSNMITGFTNAQKAVKALWATMMANPLVAITTLVAGLTAVYLIQSGVFKELTDVQAEMNQLKNDSIKSTIKEENELQRLVKLAQNQNIALEERQKAVKAINAMSPEYLNGITLETIGTDQAKLSMDKYVESLRKKALMMAGNAKIEELSKKKLALQTGEVDAGTTAYGALNDLLGKVAASYGMASSEAVTGNTIRKKLAQQEIKNIDELIQKTANLANIDLNRVDSPLSTKAGGGGGGIGKGGKKSAKDPAEEAKKKAFDESNKYFAGEYDKLTALKEKVAKEDQAIADAQASKFLTDRQKEVENLASIYDQQVNERNRLHQDTTAIDEKYQADKAAMQAKFDAEDLAAMEEKFGAVAETINTFANTDAATAAATVAAQMEKIMAIGQLVADSAGQAFSALGQSIVESMGLASTGLEGFAQVMLRTMVELGTMILKQIIMNQASAMASSIASASQSAAATGPLAVFTQPAFIATAVGGVLSAFAAIPKFAAGGIVSGPTMGLMGEYPGAKSNPEVIAPLSKLQGMMDQSNSGGGGAMTGEFVLRGQDLVVALQRAEKQRNRIG